MSSDCATAIPEAGTSFSAKRFGRYVIQLREWIAGTEFLMHHPLLCKADGSKGCDTFTFRAIALALPVIPKCTVVFEQHYSVTEMATMSTPILNPHTGLFKVVSNTLGVAHGLTGLLLPAWTQERR
jgi:hypothetical protein